MATKSENADIRELQTKMQRVEDDIKEVKDDVKTVLQKMDNLENVFVTRRELALVKAVLGVLAMLFGLYATYQGLK